MTKFKILSLDGGGIKGLFSASYLAYIEEMTGQHVVDYFDLIVGTSTGGIIALALGLGIAPRDIRKFYAEYGHEIFPRRGMLSMLTSPKYNSNALRKALEKQFKDRVLGESRTRLCIPSFNTTVNDVWIYKTAHHTNFKSDYKVRAVDIALATSAAPVYFPASAAASGALHVDGGMWANNPALVGYTEAVSILGTPQEQVFMLSVGTSEEPIDWVKATGKGGILGWGGGGRVVQLLMYGQSKATANQVKLLLRGRYLRVSPVVPPKKFGLDNADSAKELIAHGEREARHTVASVEGMFLDSQVQPFVPVYGHPGAVGNG